MKNEQNPQATEGKRNSSTIWIILVVIIIALAIGVYFVLAQEGDDENLSNTDDTVLNINADVNSNSNNRAIVNTNSATNANTVDNTNTLVNTNADTSTWLTHMIDDTGADIHYPINWEIVTDTAESGWLGGTSALASYKLRKSNSMLETSCFIQIYERAQIGLAEWLEKSELYDNELGDTIIAESQNQMDVGQSAGLQINEVGPNATRAVSIYFNTTNATVRFGYFTDMDTEYKDELNENKDICQNIANTIVIN